MTMHNTEHLHPNGESHHSHGQIPYWRRAHHDWRFWFGLLVMLVAIGIYVEPTTCRWCPLAARSKCRLVAGFHELRIGNV